MHQRQQGEVVERVAEDVHHHARAGQRQRHRHRGDQGGRQPAQEQRHHQHHHRQADQQRRLHFMQRRADGRRDVEERGQRGARLQKARSSGTSGSLTRSTVANDVRIGLLVDIHQDRRLAVEPGRLIRILLAVVDLGHVGQPHRHAVVAGDHQLGEFVRRVQRVVGGHRHRGLAVGQEALRRSHVGRASARCAVVPATAPSRSANAGSRRRAPPAWPRRAISTEDTPRAAQPLCQQGVGEVVQVGAPTACPRSAPAR